MVDSTSFLHGFSVASFENENIDQTVEKQNRKNNDREYHGYVSSAKLKALVRARSWVEVGLLVVGAFGLLDGDLAQDVDDFQANDDHTYRDGSAF